MKSLDGRLRAVLDWDGAMDEDHEAVRHELDGQGLALCGADPGDYMTAGGADCPLCLDVVDDAETCGECPLGADPHSCAETCPAAGEDEWPAATAACVLVAAGTRGVL